MTKGSKTSRALAALIAASLVMSGPLQAGTDAGNTPVVLASAGDPMMAAQLFDNARFSGTAPDDLLIRVGLGGFFRSRIRAPEGEKPVGEGERNGPSGHGEIQGAPVNTPNAPAPKDFDVETRKTDNAGPAPAWARRRHREANRRYDELLQERTQLKSQMQGKGLTKAQQVSRALREAFRALAGLVVAAVVWKIDISILQGMWTQIFSNAFGVLPPEMLVSVQSLALQGVVAVLATHYAYELLPRWAKNVTIVGLAAAATAAMTAAGDMFGVHALLEYGKTAVSGIASSGILSPVPEIANTPAPAQATGLFGDKALVVPGIVATLMTVSSVLGGVALHETIEAGKKLTYSTEITPDDRQRLGAIDKKIDGQGREIEGLEKQFPSLGQEPWAAVPEE